MSPPVGGEKVTDMTEHNYLGLSSPAAADCSSSVDSSAPPISPPSTTTNFNLKATELRLGLPGSQSPPRTGTDDNHDPDLHFSTSAAAAAQETVVMNEKLLFPLHPTSSTDCKKRGFSVAMDHVGLREGNVKGMLAPRSSPNLASGLRKDNLESAAIPREMVSSSNTIQDQTNAANATGRNQISSARAPKAQVVGWPPVRSFRQKTLATTSKNADEMEKKPMLGALFVKVSMDGAPYLRKVDLRNYSAYQELSLAIEKMFSCFTIGQFGSHPGREMLSEIKLKDLLLGSEYVLTYEDKDGDWMLVGDVPWEMFIETCKKLRIVKSVDAIGLAPRTPEKTGSVNC